MRPQRAKANQQYKTAQPLDSSKQDATTEPETCVGSALPATASALAVAAAALKAQPLRSSQINAAPVTDAIHHPSAVISHKQVDDAAAQLDFQLNSGGLQSHVQNMPSAAILQSVQPQRPCAGTQSANYVPAAGPCSPTASAFQSVDEDVQSHVQSGSSSGVLQHNGTFMQPQQPPSDTNTASTAQAPAALPAGSAGAAAPVGEAAGLLQLVQVPSPHSTQPEPVQSVLAIAGDTASAEFLTGLLGSSDCLDLSALPPTAVRKLVRTVCEQHAELSAAKKTQQKMQEALIALVHSCDTTVNGLQQHVKSAQTILQPDNSPADETARSQYDDWELTVHRVSGHHFDFFDDSPAGDVQIWLYVLTPPSTVSSAETSMQQEVSVVHLFNPEDVLNLLGQPVEKPALASHKQKVCACLSVWHSFCCL